PVSSERKPRTNNARHSHFVRSLATLAGPRGLEESSAVWRSLILVMSPKTRAVHCEGDALAVRVKPACPSHLCSLAPCERLDVAAVARHQADDPPGDGALAPVRLQRQRGR